VAEAWLVDLQAGPIEIHYGAAESQYREVRLPRADEPFSPRAFPELVVTRGDVLG
jgi:hypothetical protein